MQEKYTTDNAIKKFRKLIKKEDDRIVRNIYKKQLKIFKQIRREGQISHKTLMKAIKDKT